jgi:hypothetical protein
MQNELLEPETAGWDALCQSTGDELYGNVMTDDALIILANGMVMGRRMVVESRDDPVWADYEIDDPRPVNVCDGAYALVYTAPEGAMAVTTSSGS